MYIGDVANRRIRKIDTVGIIHTIAGTGSYGFSGDGGSATTANIESAAALCVDNSDNLYISDYARIRMINDSGIISTVAGNGTIGYAGDGYNPLMAEFHLPYDIKVDKYADIFMWPTDLIIA